MNDVPRGGIWSLLAWIIFPIVPAVLGTAYYQNLNFGLDGGPDPSEWEWGRWVVLMGPLVGYGFLAGATLGLPDRPEPRRFRRWLAKRSAWVAIGPWFGVLSGAAVLYVGSLVESRMTQEAKARFGAMFSQETAQIVGLTVLGWFAYGWLLVAYVSLRRARLRGRFLRSLGSGLIGAIAFVGSLVGTFWAVTTAWREYFFDKRIMPLILATASLTITGGCASQLTYGEVRRRELFQALLTAWLLGTALAWRWWSRSATKGADAERRRRHSHAERGNE
jgi:hypothetical protein